MAHQIQIQIPLFKLLFIIGLCPIAISYRIPIQQHQQINSPIPVRVVWKFDVTNWPFRVIGLSPKTKTLSKIHPTCHALELTNAFNGNDRHPPHYTLLSFKHSPSTFSPQAVTTKSSLPYIKTSLLA